MSAKKAREVKRWKAMMRMYCFPDGTHPGPVVPISLILRNVYRGFIFAAGTPLLDRIKTAQHPLRWGGITTYFDIIHKEQGT